MRLAMLALNALDEDKACELQHHLATCEGCQSYLEELRNVSRNISELGPLTDLPRPRDFHQKLLNRLEAERSRSVSQISNLVASFAFSWRAALPVLGASAAAIAVLLILHHQPTKPNQPATPLAKTIATTTANQINFSPTFSTYQFLANRSPEKLDELLTREANRNPVPAPIYTAATLSRSELIE